MMGRKNWMLPASLALLIAAEAIAIGTHAAASPVAVKAAVPAVTPILRLWASAEGTLSIKSTARIVISG